MIPASRNIGAGTTDLSTTDNILNIDTTLGAAIINLPKISTWFDLKNKSGAIYDADGLRYTDVSGTAGTNNITFVAFAGDLINGAATLVISANGASGVITPNPEDITSNWESSSVGAAAGAGAYDVFGIVKIDNIFVPLLDLVGLEKIYAPNYGSDQGSAMNVGGTGTIVATVSMPDLTEIYGNVIFDSNELLTSIDMSALTLVSDYMVIGQIPNSNPQLAAVVLTALVTVNTALVITTTLATSISLPALTTAGVLNIVDNTLLTTITIGTALNCTDISLTGNALTEASVDDILAKIDAAGFTKVTIDYDTLVGTFTVGETITGGTSLATAVIVSDSGTQIVANTVLGTFVVAEIITGGTSGATANTTVVDLATLDLSGGTNATPSASGLVSKASLVAKGWDVTNN